VNLAGGSQGPSARSFGEHWNLITRTIIPIINQPALFAQAENVFGVGDINPTVFLSPADPGKAIWGVGPTMTFPTGTDQHLTSRCNG
jgi:hypothetical protein